MVVKQAGGVDGCPSCITKERNMGRPTGDPFLMSDKFYIELPDELMDSRELTVEMIIMRVAEKMREKLAEFKYSHSRDKIEGCKIHVRESGRPCRIEYTIMRNAKGPEHSKAKQKRKVRKNETAGKDKKRAKKAAPKVHGGV